MIGFFLVIREQITPKGDGNDYMAYRLNKRGKLLENR